MLRLQQEETLSEIARRANTRLLQLPSPIKPVPLKFLVPFLEKASLEEVDSELIDLWAALLVSAAEDYNPHYVHFANIISQMSAQQAEVFTKILGTKDKSHLENAMDAINSEFLHNFLQEHLIYYYDHEKPQPRNIDEMWTFLERQLNVVGIEIEHIELEDLSGAKPSGLDETWRPDEAYMNGKIEASSYEDHLETDFAILDATRLVKYVDTGFFTVGERWNIKVMFYYVTSLGRGFASACGIVL